MKLKPIVLGGLVAMAALTAFLVVGRADVQEELARLDPGTRELIQISCGAERHSGDSTAFERCLSSEVQALASSGGLPQLEQVSPLVRELVESACDYLRYAGDSAGFRACMRDELIAFAASDGLPDLSDMDEVSRGLVESACGSVRAAGGPLEYADCLAAQRDALIQMGGVADLSDYPQEAQDLMDTFCGTERALNGPAGYATCLQAQIVAYDQSPGMPEMGAYGRREAADIRDSCMFERFSNDVGTYAACLWTEAEKRGPVVAAVPPPASDEALGQKVPDDLAGAINTPGAAGSNPTETPNLALSKVLPVTAPAPPPLLEGDAVAAIALNLPLDLSARRLPEPPSETFWLVAGVAPTPLAPAIAAPLDAGVAPETKETAPEEPAQPETPLIAGPAPNAVLTVVSLQAPGVSDAPAGAFTDEALSPRSPLIADVPPLEPFSSRLLATDRGPEIEVAPGVAVAEALTPADPYVIEPRTEPASIATVLAPPAADAASALDRNTAAPLPQETQQGNASVAEAPAPQQNEELASVTPAYPAFPNAPETFSPLIVEPNTAQPNLPPLVGGRTYAPEDIPSPEIRAATMIALAAVPAPRFRASLSETPAQTERPAYGARTAPAPRRRPVSFENIASSAPSRASEAEQYSLQEIEAALEGLDDDAKPLPPSEDVVEDIVSELGARGVSGGADLVETSLPAEPIVADPVVAEPVVVTAPSGLVSTVGAPPPDDGLFLLGVLAGGGRDRALLGTADGGALRVESGDVIDGWTVGSIGDDFIKLSRGEQTRFLRLP
ncbi:MAG: hypothetical protein KTR21_12260 [Rhodobacteraceae bacterium]|nr:hypothetical protein [Paracoccaceae bacterium]